MAVSARRAEFLSLKQLDGESARSFYARIKGKAATCSYNIECSSQICHQRLDFADSILNDFMIAGITEDEVKREVLGWHE